jgi:hypothetical protein
VKYSLLALIVAVAQPLPPLPRQAVNKQAENTTAKSQVSNKGQNPSDPSPSIVVVNNCPNEDASTNAANNEASNLHQDAPKQPTPWSRSDELTLAYDILTGILVVIALGTGLAVAWQAIKTAQATQAMQAGIALQEANFQQWIEMKNWTARLCGDHVFDVGFDLVNASNWPLRLVTTYITIGNEGSLREHNIMLTPKQVYTVSGLSMPFVDEWYDSYLRTNGAMQPVRGTVTYINCLRKSVPQKFSGLLMCGNPSGAVATEVRFQPFNLDNVRIGLEGKGNAKNPN